MSTEPGQLQLHVPESPALLDDPDSRANWEKPRINSIAADGRGSVWVSRDFSKSLDRVDDSSLETAQVPLQVSGQVLGHVRMVDGRLFVSTRRNLTDSQLRRSFVEPKTGALSDAGLGGQDNVLRLANDSGFWYSNRAQPKQLRHLQDAEVSPVLPPGMSDHPDAVVASDSTTGDLWYVSDSGFGVRRFNPKDGTTVSYDLPYREFGSSAPGGKPWPRVLSAYIDGEGNLWMSYVYGFWHVVCLER